MPDARLILDRYRPLADLGKGGRADVTLAYDTRMGRRVAIKRIPLARDPSGHTTRLGLAEARTAAMLNRPEIVTVFEWDSDADEAFIIMEAVEGASLAEVLDSESRLDLDESSAVVTAVSTALAYAHENGVLHLDIKPGNVLISRDGDVKLADFGISSLTGRGGSAVAAAGTVGYMPPEQLRGEPLDARADIWALAALTYELLTGKTPFDAPDERQALVLASSGEFQAASALVRGVPPEVDDVLFAALAPDPAQRYADVEAYSSALLPHLGSPRVGAARLADVVADLGSDELAEEDQAYERLGLWDRMAHVASPATRVGAVLVCGWLSWLAFKQLGVGPIPTFAAVALVALAAAFAPSLGTALALGAMALGAFKIGWLPGLVVLPFAALFWLGLGRRGRGDSLLALASPALATAWLAPAAPLLLGFTFSPVWAATSSAAACVLVMTASALSRAHPPLLNVGFRLLTNPWAPASTPGALGPLVSSAGPLLAITAWAAAGAVVSVACSRGTRGWAAVGTLAGAGIMFGAYATWSELAAPFIGTNTVALQHIVASLILMCVVIALGPPVRGEETADEAGTEEQDS